MTPEQVKLLAVADQLSAESFEHLMTVARTLGQVGLRSLDELLLGRMSISDDVDRLIYLCAARTVQQLRMRLQEEEMGNA